MYVWCNSSPVNAPRAQIWSVVPVLSRWVGEDADHAHLLLLRTACAQGAVRVQSSIRSKSICFNSILTWPNDWYCFKHIPTSTIFLIIMTLPSSRFVCWNVAFLHHKLKTSVHADAEAIIVEDVNRWMKTLNESSSYFDLFLQETLLLNFPYTGHSNQRTILTQQSLVFSHFHSDIVQAVSGCQTWLPWQRYAPYSSSNHKSVFLSHQRLPTPLSFDSAIKRRCKNRGNGSLLVLVTEARDV